MQAVLRAAGGEIARGLSAALVVKAGSQCPACDCRPQFVCPDCICRGLDRGYEPCTGLPASWALLAAFVALLVGVILGLGLSQVGQHKKVEVVKTKGKGVWLQDGAAVGGGGASAAISGGK